MKIWRSLIFLLLTSHFGIAQQYQFKDFYIKPVIRSGSEEWKQLNLSKNSFSVSIEHGLLKVYANKPTTVKMLKIPNGYFVALNSGEWIGSLFFKPTDTTKKVIFVNGSLVFLRHKAETFNLIIQKNSPDADILSYKQAVLSIGNTPDIIPYNKKWLFIQEMQGSQRYGSLNQVSVNNDTLEVTRPFIFKSFPYALNIWRDKILVATNSEIYCLNSCLEKEFNLSGLFWEGLYPNSIAAIDLNHIYIGMRGGYAEVNMSTRAINFYAYKE